MATAWTDMQVTFVRIGERADKQNIICVSHVGHPKRVREWQLGQGLELRFEDLKDELGLGTEYIR